LKNVFEKKKSHGNLKAVQYQEKKVDRMIMKLEKLFHNKQRIGTLDKIQEKKKEIVSR
jgi:hypothetical protein